MTDHAHAGLATPWRLILHPPADGAWNMAVDEVLLDACAARGAPVPPTLRLYAWEPAALSLGKGQVAADSHDPAYLRRQAIDLVRRPTGGRAVLHEAECTYAVIGRLGSPPFPSGVLETYRRVSEALWRGLRELGLREIDRAAPAGAPGAGGTSPACFASTSAHEITHGGSKLVGSAQLRRRGAFLQHGSIPLRFDGERLAKALGAGASAGGSTDLTAALGRTPESEEVRRALVEGFARTFGAPLLPCGLTSAEKLQAERLRCWKYDSAEWTLGGRVGLRERRWGPALQFSQMICAARPSTPRQSAGSKRSVSQSGSGSGSGPGTTSTGMTRRPSGV